MRVLGIDPGLATVGLGLVERERGGAHRAVDWLTITTAAGLPLPDRLREIHDDLLRFCEDTRPDLAVVEKLFFQTNVKTAIDVAQARGVILLALAEANVPVLEPNPMELKLAITGDGRADKRQMQDMLTRTLALAQIPSPDDAADALALALFGALRREDFKMQAPKIPSKTSKKTRLVA
jgi:crossover junction endodeoxyribonuclease RuvC